MQRHLGRFNGDHDMSLALRLSRVEFAGDDFAEVHGRIDELIAAGELEHEGRSLKVVTPLQQLGRLPPPRPARSPPPQRTAPAAEPPQGAPHAPAPAPSPRPARSPPPQRLAPAVVQWC